MGGPTPTIWSYIGIPRPRPSASGRRWRTMSLTARSVCPFLARPIRWNTRPLPSAISTIKTERFHWKKAPPPRSSFCVFFSRETESGRPALFWHIRISPGERRICASSRAGASSDWRGCMGDARMCFAGLWNRCAPSQWGWEMFPIELICWNVCRCA